MAKIGTSSPSKFEELLLRKNDNVGLSLLLILAWISASDGSIEEQEKQDIYKIAKAGANSECVPIILSIASASDMRSIQLACEVIKTAFHGERAYLFMELAIGMAISDRYLLPSENHILRFLADLLGLSNSKLNQEFERITGKPLPDAPDVSSQSYWNARRKRAHSKNQGERKSQGRSSQTQSAASSTYNHHYATLGLEPGASQEEIKVAYRRLAKVHHPDRFESLGKEAVEAAHVTFTRIQHAYDYLSKYA